MALADVLRAGVATAARILSSGQMIASVTHARFTAANEYDESQAPTLVTLDALVDRRTRVVRDQSGAEVVAAATLTFFANLDVDYHDTFSVDGVEFGRVLTVSKGVTPISGGAFVTEVVCGG